MLKRLLLTTILFLAPTLHASEYVLYKDGVKDGKAVMLPLDEKEHAAAYQVLMKYQFPMSLCHDLEKELSEKELAALDASEEKFLQSRMPAEIKVAFIPKVVYELLFLKFFLEDLVNSKVFAQECPGNLCQKIRNRTIPHPSSFKELEVFFKGHNNDWGAHTNYTLDSYHQYLSKGLEQIPTTDSMGHNYTYLRWHEAQYRQAMANFNNDEHILAFHNKFNTAIVGYLHTVPLPQEFDRLITLLVTDIVKIYNHNACKNIYSHHNLMLELQTWLLHELTTYQFIQERHVPIFKAIARNESQAHAHNKWLIYRGTIGLYPLIDSTLTKHQNYECHSLSYGNSALCGLLYDCKQPSTLAYRHAVSGAFGLACGYTLAINKKEYRLKGTPYPLFFIAPFTTLSGLCLRGDQFHPRTKVTGKFSYYGGHIENAYLRADNQRYPSALAFEKEFQDYLAKNISFFKDRPTVAEIASQPKRILQPHSRL
jgi:hypothetical protein